MDPVDTTGAGDAFVGVLAASLDLGHEVRGGVAARERRGGLACAGSGAQASQPRAAQIEARLEDLAPPVRWIEGQGSRRIPGGSRSSAAAAQACSGWRRPHDRGA